jgi:hypothetical protein
MTFDESLRRRVKSVCCARGVSVTAISGYYSFALQVEKTRRRAKGSDLAVVAAALVERYVKLGLSRKVLEAIRHDVFSIGVPLDQRPGA